MIFKNAMSFKAKVKNMANELGLSTQQVQQNYILETFLVKLSKSEYRNNFVIKGGYLIGGLIGLSLRARLRSGRILYVGKKRFQKISDN